MTISHQCQDNGTMRGVWNLQNLFHYLNCNWPSRAYLKKLMRRALRKTWKMI